MLHRSAEIFRTVLVQVDFSTNAVAKLRKNLIPWANFLYTNRDLRPMEGFVRLNFSILGECRDGLFLTAAIGDPNL